jgi:hypothetical protein
MFLTLKKKGGGMCFRRGCVARRLRIASPLTSYPARAGRKGEERVLFWNELAIRNGAVALSRENDK